MSRETFHEELEKTELELLSLGELAGTAVQRAVDGLMQHDDAKAQAVIDADDQIDELYLSIDSARAAACSRCSRPSRRTCG